MPQYTIQADMRYTSTIWEEDQEAALQKFWDSFGLDPHLYDEEELDTRVYRISE